MKPLGNAGSKIGGEAMLPVLLMMSVTGVGGAPGATVSYEKTSCHRSQHGCGLERTDGMQSNQGIHLARARQTCAEHKPRQQGGPGEVMRTRTAGGCMLSKNAGTATVICRSNTVRAPSALVMDTTSVPLSPTTACEHVADQQSAA